MSQRVKTSAHALFLTRWSQPENGHLQKNNYSVVYINFKVLFMLTRHFKKELVFHCQTLSVIFDYDNICSMTLHSVVNVFISLGEIHRQYTYVVGKYIIYLYEL